MDGRGRPVLRKVSAHGLGHLLAPYQDEDAPRKVPKPKVPLNELGVERWQHDVWYRIVRAALGGKPELVRLDDLPGFDGPAVSRYAATSPNLLRWFKGYHEDKPYREQVRPFGFLLSYQPHPTHAGKIAPRPISAYEMDPEAGAMGCFDRETGRPVPPEQLKTYRQVLSQYHLHPETKFHNGDYLDSGGTARRHIEAEGIQYIGKEANKWEQQYHLGLDSGAQVEYGASPEETDRMSDTIIEAARTFGRSRLAVAAGMSPREVSTIVRETSEPSQGALTALCQAARALEVAERERMERVQNVMDSVRVQSKQMSVRKFAQVEEVHYGHLCEMLAGRRSPGRDMLTRLERALKEEHGDRGSAQSALLN